MQTTPIREYIPRPSHGTALAIDRQPVLEPDDDFRRALSVEEFKEKLMVVLERVDRKYADK